MSLFDTPIAQLGTQDLQQLLDGGAVENMRLEFKRDVPNKDEALKKLSSFANTFGGIMLVGAEASSKDGRLAGLPGVEKKPSYKQTIVQWCTNDVSPPLPVEVSDPIQAPDGNGRVCYVISIGESELAPHFLNGRKGVYVRTDEFSKPFEPGLADERELRHLLDRRRLIRERREGLIARARERFATFTQQQAAPERFGRKALPVFLNVTIVPQYPVQPVVDHSLLLGLVQSASVPRRGSGFPRDINGIICQHETVVVLSPSDSWSLLDVNTWGMLSYSTSVGEESDAFAGIHAHRFLGSVLVFLEYAGIMMKNLSMPSALRVEVLMQGIRGVPWVSFPYGAPAQGPNSVLDDSLRFSLTTTTETVVSNRDQLAANLLRVLFFAMNWPGAADSPDKLAQLIRAGCKYNGWS